jgi:predicted RNase H-like HicB family nuclease
MYFIARSIAGKTHVIEIEDLKDGTYSAVIPAIPGTRAIGDSKEDAADRAAWLVERKNP